MITSHGYSEIYKITNLFTDSLATPISQQFSLPLQCLSGNDGNPSGAAPDLFTLTLTDGSTVQLRVEQQASKASNGMSNDNNFSGQNGNGVFLSSSINESSCPSGLHPMMSLDPTVQPTTIEFPAHHQVVFNNGQAANENSRIIQIPSPGNTVTQSNIEPIKHTQQQPILEIISNSSLMGAQREPVTIQDVDLSSPITQKHDEVQVEDFDDILKNIMDSADNNCSTENCNSNNDSSCTKEQNVLSSSENINKDVTLQLAAPVSNGDDDDDVSKLNSLQTTLSSMSSYLSHLKTGLKGYDLPVPPTDVQLSFESLTTSNFPDLLNYHVTEKETRDSSTSKSNAKRITRSSSSASKYSKYNIAKANTNLNDKITDLDEFDADEETTEMDGSDNRPDSAAGDFIDDELLSMFTSVHNTTIESLKARLMASRLPDGSSETDLGALLVAAKIDLTVDDIVTPALNAVKKVMDSHDLTDWQQTLCLKIRRRKKNTVSKCILNSIIILSIRYMEAKCTLLFPNK